MNIYYDEQKELEKLFVGHKVVVVDDETIELDNGVRAKLHGNEGGCLCNSGDYFLTELNGCDNIITSVEVVHEGDYEEHYRLFVFADNKKVNLATFEGTDGNGYYGTGFYIDVLV